MNYELSINTLRLSPVNFDIAYALGSDMQLLIYFVDVTLYIIFQLYPLHSAFMFILFVLLFGKIL